MSTNKFFIEMDETEQSLLIKALIAMKESNPENITTVDDIDGLIIKVNAATIKRENKQK